MRLAVADATIRGRAVAFGLTALVVLLAWLPLTRATWRSSHEVHTVLETIATVLALIIALVAIVRYHSHPSEKLFYFSAAFVAAMLLGAFHTAITSPFIAERVLAGFDPSTFSSPGGWSGFLATLPLALLLWMSVRSRASIDPHLGSRARARWLAVGLIGLALFVVGIVGGALPSYYRTIGPVTRPLEVVPAGFFALALAGTLWSRRWMRDDLDLWLALGLILIVAAQVPYLIVATAPGTPIHDGAHVLKILSFTCILIGLVLSMHGLFRQADQSGQAMARANAVLRMSEMKLAEAQRLAHIGSWDWDIATDRVTWSDEMYRVYGYQPGEIDVRLDTFLECVHPEDRALSEGVVRRALVDQAPFEFYHRIIRPDGEVRILHGRGATIAGPDGRPARMWGTGQDITWRMTAEAELAEASRRLADSREAERLLLAQELHDGPLQDLYGVRLYLGELAKSLPATDGRMALDEPQAALRDIIDRLRGICHDLRPPALAPFGLEVAIRSHAERFRAAHPGMSLDLDLDPDKQQLSERTRMALYRIYRQALDNVARHAEAEHIQVRLLLRGGQVSLSIHDDGRGFEVPRRWLKFARQGHLGLLGASERAEAIDGRLEVESAPGEGTLIRVSAPIAPGAERGVVEANGERPA